MATWGSLIRRAEVVHAPPIRAGWNKVGMTLVTFLAMLPPLAVSVVERGAKWLLLLLVSLIVVLTWQALFAVVRGRPWPLDGVLAALTFALVLPPSLAVWKVAISLSFGIVAGQELFGGRGHSFLNPAVVALSFLIFSFPGVGLHSLTAVTALSVIPGALLLVAVGLLSWRIIAGALAGTLVVAFASGMSEPLHLIVVASFVFGLVVYAADPVAAASTNPGRWLYGLLFGALTVVLSGAGPHISIESVILAALLSSVFAPLIDVGTIWFNVYRRRRRYG